MNSLKASPSSKTACGRVVESDPLPGPQPSRVWTKKTINIRPATDRGKRTGGGESTLKHHCKRGIWSHVGSASSSGPRPRRPRPRRAVYILYLKEGKRIRSSTIEVARAGKNKSSLDKPRRRSRSGRRTCAPKGGILRLATKNDTWRGGRQTTPVTALIRPQQNIFQHVFGRAVLGNLFSMLFSKCQCRRHSRKISRPEKDYDHSKHRTGHQRGGAVPGLRQERKNTELTPEQAPRGNQTFPETLSKGKPVISSVQHRMRGRIQPTSH